MIAYMLLALALSVLGQELLNSDSKQSNLDFTSCHLPQWNCVNQSKDLSWYVTSLTYECTGQEIIYKPVVQIHNYNYNRHQQQTISNSEEVLRVVPGENVTIDLAEWKKWNLESLTIRNCHSVVLRMHLDFPSKIKKLTVLDTDILYVKPPNSSQHIYHPYTVIFSNISSIPELPAKTITSNETKMVIFNGVTIKKLCKGAINLLTPIEAFTLNRVKVVLFKEESFSVMMDTNKLFLISASTFPYLKSNSISVTGGSVVIEGSFFKLLQESSIIVKAESFSFISNNISVIKYSLHLTTPEILIQDNTLRHRDIPNMVYWNSYEYGDYPQLININFIGNTHDEQGLNNQDLSRCISESFILVDDGNCKNNTSTSIYYSSQRKKPNNDRSFNFLICQNSFDFGIPAEWFPETKTERCSDNLENE